MYFSQETQDITHNKTLHFYNTVILKKFYFM